MKKSLLKATVLILAVSSLAAVFAGCGKTQTAEQNHVNPSQAQVSDNNVSELEVSFGYGGKAFVLHLEENPTAATLVEAAGIANLDLPIYHYDDYENWEIMQYYAVPTRYEIPTDPQTVTSEKAGEVYFDENNRIVLFYRDGEIEGQFTKIGYFDYSEDFLSAVENNPVLEDWGNKIVSIRRKK
mgnify:CR=1 FL=1